MHAPLLPPRPRLPCSGSHPEMPEQGSRTMSLTLLLVVSRRVRW